MTPDRTDETPDDGAEHGVLDDSGALDTTSISILGQHTAQVSVDLPVPDEDDVDDDVVEDEMPVIEAEDRAFEVVGIVHLPDADNLPLLTHVPDPDEPADVSGAEEMTTGEIVLEPHEGADIDDAEVHEAEIVPDDAVETADGAVADIEMDATTDDAPTAGVTPAEGDDRDLEAAAPSTQEADEEPESVEENAASAPEVDDAPDVEDAPHDQLSDVEEATVPAEAEEDSPGESAAEAHERAAGQQDAAAAEPVDVESVASAAAEEEPAGADPARDEPATRQPAAEAAPTTDAQPEPEPVSAAQPTPSVAEESEAALVTGPVPRTRAERAATGAIGTVPLTRREVHQADEAARAGRVHASERVRTPGTDVTLTSKRLGEIDDARESPDLLTADRLLDPRQIARPEPEGLWQQLVYSVSRHRINLGDGQRARARKDLDRRISTPLAAQARFVPVLSRKGGVGKTTVTALLGMALADARDDRVIAVDANPDRGTLADRVGRANGRTVRDLVRAHDEVEGYSDVSSIVARDATRLDVLASDSDPRVSEAFSDDDYRRVADIAAHYYSIVLTDTGTGIVHSVMEATLELADSLVIVAGLSVDEARLASETLTWLETNGYADRVRGAVVVLNNARPGAPLVRESELEAHFRSRVRTVIRMPYDSHVAAGSAIAFRDLRPATRQASRELAAAVVEGLRTPAVVA